VHAFDIRAEALDAAERLGAEPAAGVTDLAARCDAILTSVPAAPDVEQVYLGPEGLLAAARQNALLVDMTTNRVELARRLHDLGTERGLSVVDAPVSWGEGGLNIMVGATPEDFARVEPALRVIGGKVTHVGPPGCGQVAKLVNQMIMAGTWGIIAEAFVIASKAGADPARVLTAINTAGAASRLLEGMVARMVEGDHPGGRTLALHTKDLQYALELAHEVQAPAPLLAFLHEVFRATPLHYEGEASQTAIARFWEVLAQHAVSGHDPGGSS